MSSEIKTETTTPAIVAKPKKSFLKRVKDGAKVAAGGALVAATSLLPIDGAKIKALHADPGPDKPKPTFNEAPAQPQPAPKEEAKEPVKPIKDKPSGKVQIDKEAIKEFREKLERVTKEEIAEIERERERAKAEIERERKQEIAKIEAEAQREKAEIAERRKQRMILNQEIIQPAAKVRTGVQKALGALETMTGEAAAKFKEGLQKEVSSRTSALRIRAEELPGDEDRAIVDRLEAYLVGKGFSKNLFLTVEGAQEEVAKRRKAAEEISDGAKKDTTKTDEVALNRRS